MSKNAPDIDINTRLPAWLQYKGNVDIVSVVNLGTTVLNLTKYDAGEAVKVHKENLTMDEMAIYLVGAYFNIIKELNEQYTEEEYPFRFDSQIFVIAHGFKPNDVYSGAGAYIQNIKPYNSLKDLLKHNKARELYN